MTDAQQPAAANNSLPLFYKQPAPLEPQRHAGAGLKPRSDYSFARGTNAVPLVVSEFSAAARHYPIVFSANAPVVPFAVVGVRDNENLFVGKDGQWQEDLYIPAYVRRYPFILTPIPNSDQLALCVDEAADHFEKPSTQPFFVDGKPSENLQRALKFNQEFHGQVDLTRQFCDWLDQNGLLEERVANAQTPNGQSYTLQGFRLINSEKLNAFGDAQVLDLHKKGWLPLFHFHYQSLQNWSALSRLVQQKATQAAA
jgi:hypothetical protein